MLFICDTIHLKSQFQVDIFFASQLFVKILNKNLTVNSATLLLVVEATAEGDWKEVTLK